MPIIKKRKKKPTLTKGTTVFVKPDTGYTQAEIGRFRNELNKQRQKAQSRVRPQIEDSYKGITLTRGVSTKLTVNIKNPKLSASVGSKRLKFRNRVGKVKLVSQKGVY